MPCCHQAAQLQCSRPPLPRQEPTRRAGATSRLPTGFSPRLPLRPEPRTVQGSSPPSGLLPAAPRSASGRPPARAPLLAPAAAPSSALGLPPARAPLPAAPRCLGPAFGSLTAASAIPKVIVHLGPTSMLPTCRRCSKTFPELECNHQLECAPPPPDKERWGHLCQWKHLRGLRR